MDQCPAAIQPYVQCKPSQDQQTTCTVTIPGYFKMRSRFVDFTGTYVLHCRILIHDDRGMMQLVEVMPEQASVCAALRSGRQRIEAGPQRFGPPVRGFDF